MARIFLYCLYDQFAAGVRQLAACAKDAGHVVHMCFVNQEGPASEVISPHGENLSDSTKNIASRYGIFYTPSVRYHSLSKQTLMLLQESAKNFSPDIIGYSGRSWTENSVPATVETLKAVFPKALYVAGGMGPTASPGFYLEKLGFDVVVRGEGEKVFIDLCNAHESHSPFSTIESLVYKSGEETIFNSMSPQIADLDLLPTPLWGSDGESTFIDNDSITNRINFLNGKYYCQASRGCIAKCSYCATGSMYKLYQDAGHKVLRYRTRSEKSVFKELMLIKDSEIKHIRFTDEYFIRKTSELIDFFTRYNECIAIPYEANFNTSQLANNKELCHLVMEHLTWFPIGIQSGCDKFNRNIFNRITHLNDALSALYTARERLVPSGIHLIEGFSLKDEDAFRRDLDFVKRLPPFSPEIFRNVAIFTFQFSPLLGSPIVENFPTLLDQEPNAQLFLYQTALLNLRYFYGTDDDAFDELYTHPEFKKNPFSLYKHYLKLLRNSNIEYIKGAAKKLHGQDVYFWGSGEVYEQNKHFFTGCNPLGILIDEKWLDTRLGGVKDGIPIYSAKQALNNLERRIPIVIFVSQMYISDIIHRLVHEFKYTPDNLTICCLKDSV